MNYRVQHSAGGIVYRKADHRVEVAMIKDSYGRWTFPKGHLEPNETFEEAAKREIAEELGLEAERFKTRAELGEMEYWFTSSYPKDREQLKTKGPVKIHKYVTYFLFETSADAALQPQEGEVEAAEWVPWSEINERNEYDDNRELISRAKRFLIP